MLKMARIEHIKHLYEEEGKSLREIAEIVGVNFRTAQKYASKYDFNTGDLPSVTPEKFPVLGPYISIIDGWLEHDRREPRKQRHTAMRIYTRLHEEHSYGGSYCSVRRYVSRKRWLVNQEREGHLPIAQPPGHAHKSVAAFLSDWTSVTEDAALWRIERDTQP